MATPQTPSYRRQRAPRKSGKPDRAFVMLDGQRHYLGEWNTSESRAAYRKAIAEWSAGEAAAPPPEIVYMVELVAKFLAWADTYYVGPNGKKTTSIHNYDIAVKPVTALYGKIATADFKPAMLKVVRDQYIRGGMCRPVVNQMTNLVRRVVKWGVAEGLVPVAVYEALRCVDGLLRGRCDAHDREPVRPVPEGHIEAVMPYLSKQVQALIRLQLLTGARAGELVGLRLIDLDTNGKVWLAKVAEHKGAWRGHDRTIYLGPEGQKIVKGFMKDRPVDAPLFSPIEAVADQMAAKNAARVTPLHHGNRAGTNRVKHPEAAPRDHYTTATYRRAIARACAIVWPHPTLEKRQDETGEQWQARLTPEQKADLAEWRRQHSWHPHQLRHNAGTRLRREFGLDMSRTILGHRLGSMVTELYSEADRAKAIDIMGKIG